MSGISEGEIRICPKHRDHEVPVIYTFAFRGAEYWCPYCGFTAGMMDGQVVVVVRTQELNEREKKYKELSDDFLDAKSTDCCESLMWEGKRISPDDLPQKEKDRLAKVIADWKYEGSE